MDGQNLTRANAWLAVHTASSVPTAFVVDERRPPGPIVQITPNNSAVFVPRPGTQLWDSDTGRMSIAR